MLLGFALMGVFSGRPSFRAARPWMSAENLGAPAGVRAEMLLAAMTENVSGVSHHVYLFRSTNLPCYVEFKG